MAGFIGFVVGFLCGAVCVVFAGILAAASRDSRAREKQDEREKQEKHTVWEEMS